jgi:hypothetical protein
LNLFDFYIILIREIIEVQYEILSI